MTAALIHAFSAEDSIAEGMIVDGDAQGKRDLAGASYETRAALILDGKQREKGGGL